MTKPIAIITGASTGIGKELAVELSNDYFVYLISRNIENLNKTKAIIHNKNNDCEVISADISDEESVKKIHDKISNKDNIELLINNAGVAIFKDISDTTVNDWDQTINVNLRGSFLITKLLIENFKSQIRNTNKMKQTVNPLKLTRDKTPIEGEPGQTVFSKANQENI